MDTTGTPVEGRPLDSWKEIASYLGRSVRSVQRYERELALPVHRLATRSGQTVYARPEELERWRRSRERATGERGARPGVHHASPRTSGRRPSAPAPQSLLTRSSQPPPAVTFRANGTTSITTAPDPVAAWRTRLVVATIAGAIAGALAGSAVVLIVLSA